MSNETKSPKLSERLRYILTMTGDPALVSRSNLEAFAEQAEELEARSPLSEEEVERLVTEFFSATPRPTTIDIDVTPHDVAAMVVRHLNARGLVGAQPQAVSQQEEPAGWRYKTPHGWVVTKTCTSADSEPLYARSPAPVPDPSELVRAGDAMKERWLEFNRTEEGTTDWALAAMNMGDACDDWDTAKSKAPTVAEPNDQNA